MSLEKALIDLERYCAKAWRQYAKHDELSQLSFNEFDYLRMIKEAGDNGVRITDLADEMSVTKPSASNMVARLERKQLVMRRPCPEDARSSRIVVTQQLLEQWALENVVYRDIVAKLSAKLTDDETSQLIHLLNKSLS
ncbi:MarR family winged helix-turn-helix transcriptional regulator [Vibrio sp. WXL103]|uniref:MarR family winged helix-turn-helix transcriptional regulator n=1 Tax=unclassified Vibrio TaxID=2614977 RepID=UPI003EC8A62F